MNFAMLPPEVNSGRMYHGPGSTSLAAAVAAWDRLAARLCAAAADHRNVTAQLQAVCTDPATRGMAASAAAYADWLHAAAGHAESAAVHAAAAVRAHRAALTAMVPPPVIASNRTRRTSLAAANCLGQSAAQIAQTEADYERMWARDAEAMYAYARACADASPLAPFAPPPGAGRVHGDGSGPWRLTSAPDVVSSGRRVMAAIPEALLAVSLSPLASFDVSLSPVTAPLSRLSSLSAPSGIAISHLNSLNKAAALRCLFPNRGGAPRAPIGARAGRSASIGALSVPQVWSAAATPPAVYRGTVA